METCVICYTNPANDYIECFHNFCTECIQRMTICAICRCPYSQDFINSHIEQNTSINQIISNLQNNIGITSYQRTIYINYIKNISLIEVYNIINQCQNIQLKNNINNIINETNNILDSNNFSQYNLIIIQNMLNLLDNLIMDNRMQTKLKEYINKIKLLF